MKASIIILNWNTTNDTIECLESLRKQTEKDFEVVIVDNNSREDEFFILKRYVEGRKNLRINLIRSTASLSAKPNLGFAEGNNVGIRVSKGSIIVLLNNDTIVDEKWLEEILKPFSDPKVAVSASKVLFYDGKNNETIQYAGGHLTFYGMAISEGSGKKDAKCNEVQKETFWAMGASFAVRRSVLEELKEYLCPLYFTYFEEVDLCWRIKSLGYKTIYQPSSLVFHKGTVSVKRNNMSSTTDRFTTRNKYLTFWRNLPKTDFLLILPFLLVCDTFRSIKNILVGRPGFAIGFLLGLKDFILNTILNTKDLDKPRNGRLSDLSW